MPQIHPDQATVNQSSSFTLPIFTAPPEFAPTREHPNELLKKCLGQFPRAERRVIDDLRGWLTRPGAPAYLTIRRETLARAAECCVATVSRAFARARALGLLDIQERWRKRGNLWLQISNVIRLPLKRPKRVPPSFANPQHRPENKKKEL